VPEYIDEPWLRSLGLKFWFTLPSCVEAIGRKAFGFLDKPPGEECFLVISTVSIKLETRRRFLCILEAIGVTYAL